MEKNRSFWLDLFFGNKNAREYDRLLADESKEMMVTPIKVMAVLVMVSGLLAMVFEVKYFSPQAAQVYFTRFSAIFIAFIVLIIAARKKKIENPSFLVHVLLLSIIVSSGYMIYLLPSTLVVNAQIVGLMIFLSAMFLTWRVENQIIVACYYNIVIASAILLNPGAEYFLPNNVDSIIFIIFLSLVSVIGSFINFKLRLNVAQKSFNVDSSEKKFKSIFNNSAEGLFQSTLDGKFLIVNPALVKLLGYNSQEELMKLDINKQLFKHQEDRIKLLNILKEKGRVRNYIVTLKKKDGADVIVRLDDRMVVDPATNMIYFEGNMHDITDQIIAERERKKAEEELKIQKAKADKLALEATKSSSLKSQFLANMSHEIRTPMNGVIGFLSLLEKEAFKDREEAKQFAVSAKRSAESLLDIINDILDLSKIESGKIQIEEADINLSEIVDTSISILSAKINEKNLAVSSYFADDTPLFLVGDATRIRQIFVNLIGNSIKFTESGFIKINIKPVNIENDSVVIYCSVEDSGIGIPQNKQETLFKPFSQVHGSLSKNGGTGLGLVISKEFVNIMGGEIGVVSEEGKGSKFYFTLRLKPQRKKPAAPSKDNGKNYSFTAPTEVKETNREGLKLERNKFKILLAEDNAINQKVIVRILSEAGYECDSVVNGLEAFNAVKQNDYDLVLMDVQMPEMDGLTSTKNIRRLDAPKNRVPIIAITAHALMGDKEKCIQAGMNDYLSKPINAEQMIAVLDRILDVKGDFGVKEESKKSPDVIFNFDHLENMSSGDPEFKKELIESYLEDLNMRFKNLEEYVETKNTQLVVREAHTIKGASFSVGANLVANEAFGIELSGKHNDIEAIELRMRSLRSAVSETKALLENLEIRT
jgi:PAS domain S-box-containing protein